jgi:hypothetical protein
VAKRRELLRQQLKEVEMAIQRKRQGDAAAEAEAKDGSDAAAAAAGD